MGRTERVAAGAKALFEDAFPGLAWEDSDPAERPVWLRSAALVHDAIFPPSPFVVTSTTWPLSWPVSA